MNENVLIFSWTIVGKAALVVILVTLFGRAEASDWSLGLLAGSFHLIKEEYQCDGEDRSFNENNPGLFLGYKALVAGRFENSFSGCGDIKYSNLLGLEGQLGRTGPVHWSFTAAVADGYPEEESTYDEYRAWASVNMRYGPLKLWYSYHVLAFGLEFEL